MNNVLFLRVVGIFVNIYVSALLVEIDHNLQDLQMNSTAPCFHVLYYLSLFTPLMQFYSGDSLRSQHLLGWEDCESPRHPEILC